MKKTLTAAACLICLLLFAGNSAEKTMFSPVSYPLEGNLNFEEGTIELWIKPEIDLDSEEARKSFYSFFLLRIALGNKLAKNGGLSITWNPNLGLYVYGGRKDGDPLKNLPTCWPKKMKWEKDVWHHTAFTWQNKEMALYADGKLIDKRIAAASFPYDKEGFIMLGFADSKVSVDEFCVSSVARSPEDIEKRHKGELIEDEYTLILDHMESLDEGIPGRQLNKDINTIVEGKYGNGIRIYKD